MTLGDILKTYGKAYQKKNKLPNYILNAMSALENCRTSILGGYLYKCEKCSKMHIHYHSCRNRHCPLCQSNTVYKWVEKRQSEALPVPYYHVIFTVPHLLNPIFQRNQKLMYDILFKTSSETLMTLVEDPKYVGSTAGFMSILHTWGQNMMEHSHIHTLIPAGGMSKDKNYWVDPKRDKYLIPAHVISNLFKKKFLYEFEKAYENKTIKFMGDIKYLKDKKKFYKLKDQLYKKGWVANIRPTFSTANVVIDYLSRYINRVAISNNRIIKVENHQVTFTYTDNRDKKKKTLTLDVMKFIRRFLLHVLPKKFVKIRYYGFMSNSQ